MSQQSVFHLIGVKTTLLLLISAVACDFPFRNVSLPWNDRVDDLVNRLTLEEIQDQLSRGGSGISGPAPAIPRLKIKPYSWNTECLRGDVQAGKATSFPQSIGLAAAFSPELIFKVAEATSEEVRAKYNDYSKHEVYGDHKGLSCFSPVINIMRHPLWGRNQETYGEDPYLSGVYSQHFVAGLQGHDARYIRANAGCKHFDMYAGPESTSFDAMASERDWRLTYLPAFRRCVKAGSYSLMCSYQSINGVPSCVNKRLLTDVLRSEWKFNGYVVSDMGALEFSIISHFYYFNMVDAAAGALNAGCNLELSANLSNNVFQHILSALKQSKVTEATMRQRVKPLFYTRMRLGEFDPPNMNPFTKLNLSVLQSPEHQKLSLTAAIQSLVLLKNAGILPLKQKHYNTIAIVGPMGDNIEQLYGDYSADPVKTLTVTPLKGLSILADKTNFAAGCSSNTCRDYQPKSVQNAVKDTEMIFVCLGTGQELETEDKDRSTMDLPTNQSQILEDVITYANGTPVVLLLFNAGPLNLTIYLDNPAIGAILECFFPAQFAGDAIRIVLLKDGDRSNPAGRLPFTWLAYNSQIPSIKDYSMAGKTYRYFVGVPLFPFGFGLSYSSFNYSDFTMYDKVVAGQNLNLSVLVTNLGPYNGDEVVQVYMSWPYASERMPNLQLVAFDRVYIRVNEQLKVTFTISAEDMAIWTDDRGFVIEQGIMMLNVGGQQPDQKRRLTSNVLTREFYIKGSLVLEQF